MPVFKVTSTWKNHERVSTCGGMDSELTGRVLDETRVQHVLAPNEAMARTWFETCFSPRACNGVIVSVEQVIDRIDTIITFK